MYSALLQKEHFLHTTKAAYYLHDCSTAGSALDFQDADTCLAATGVGFYLTADAEQFAATIAGLRSGQTSLAYWDFYRIHWYVQF